MSKDYSVDDILSEIKAKKSRQGRGETTARAPRPARTALEQPLPEPDFTPQKLPQPEEPPLFDGFDLPALEEEPPTKSAPPPKPTQSVPPAKRPAFGGFDLPALEEEPPTKSAPPSKSTQSVPPAKRPAFGGFDLPELEEEPPTKSAPPSKPRANPDYHKYFKNIGEDTPESPPPAEGELTEDSIFSTGFLFPQGQAKKTVPTPPQHNLEFDTTLFDKPTPANEPAEREDKFKITLPDDVMVDDDAPNLFPIEVDGEAPKERKHKNLFSRERKPLEDDAVPSLSSRLASSEVPVPEAFEETDGTIDDYSSPQDKEAILRDMKSIKQGLLLRTVLLSVVFIISLYLSLASRDIKINEAGDLLPLLDILWPETHFRTYMIVSTVIAALSALICSNTVGGGLLALLKFHANTDSLPALATLGALGQGICFIVRPDFFNADKAHFAENLSFFFPVAIFILLFNLVGKLMVILRIQNNFKLVASDRVKYSVAFLKEKNLLRELTKGLSMEEYTVAYPEKARFLSGFLDNSYSEDHAEGMSRILAPLCLLAGIALAVIAYLFHKSIPEAVTTFTAVLCICAPLTSTIAANLPLLRLSNKLIPLGTMVSGFSAVDAFSRTEAVVLGACDIFKPDNVVLHGIKSFDQGKIDAVILDAASVVCSTNGMLTTVFSKIIGADKSMLKPVENIAYEDSMGLSAWVDGKRVLIGNRELMQNHGIDVPTNDYEMRYVKDSKNIIYLANSGKLSAMFVISYNPNSAVQEELDQLIDRGMYLVVETSDPNITAEKIRAAYAFPIDQIKLLPAKFHTAYLALTAEKNQAPAKIGMLASGKNMIQAICSCAGTKTAVEMAVMIQMIALVMGYGLVAIFSLMGNLPVLSVIHLLLFQLLWAILGITIPNAKKI